MSDAKKPVWCFVHAPLKNGWEGELVLVSHKHEGKFRLQDVHKTVHFLFYNDDPDDFHYDTDVVSAHVSAYISRKANGLMQRRSRYGTLEDMHYDEWQNSILEKYPSIFFLNSPEPITEDLDEKILKRVK